ncbi:DnaB-like helicase C-terminal domain-containing protein [Bacillus subtilis]|uniref:DnaB-like helicase C-terminal domain-containing protein n=1 Tax=Bacillus subtilis TaxID=1423 RepID=UPI00296E337D|nr:DnaB-like helicase C-terminal domain-containing protein [Bacillus subtilis]MDW4547485.1 DnaB-like helicase C-terminal domain-containing protein [Bacillus subtilis subsp. subtilis]
MTEVNSTTTDNVMKALNPTRAVYSVIGSLCKNPHLLRDSEIIITEKDFAHEFHQIVFSSIYNIAYSNYEVTKIDEIDLDNYLASFPQHYKIWEKNDGLSYIRKSIAHANENTFKSSYDRLKKISLLRHYVLNGIDVSDLYNWQSTDLKVRNDGMKKIDSMTVNEIIDHYTIKLSKIKDEFNIGQETKSFMAGDDLDTLLDELDEDPEYGNPFTNKFYNTIFRGKRKTKLMLRSAGTGTGKTRQALADMCNASCDEIFDIDQNKYVSNGPSIPTLFISTELVKREVQTIMLAFISGVDEDVIKDGKYSEVVLRRLKKAIEILKRAPIFCEYVNDFSISDIETIIERHIIENNIQECAFDYIQMTPKLSRTMASAFGNHLREDQILHQFSSSLKILAEKYDIFIASSTQLNRGSKDIENRDPSALRGGQATADKVDFGILTFRAGASDHHNLKHILQTGFTNKKPNYSHWVYKNRGGKYSNVIIWTYMNLGTMREEPLFVTDYDFNLLDVHPMDIEYAIEATEDSAEEVPVF